MDPLRPSILIGAAVAATACYSSTEPDMATPPDHSVQVWVRATSQAQWALAAASSPSRSAAGSDITALQIQEVFVVLGGLKLETAGLDETVDWVLEESVVIAVDLDGDPILAFSTDVPAGLYKELELSVDKLEDGNAREQALIGRWPELSDASVLVRGALARQGGGLESWEFAAALDVDLELEFGMPFEATGDATSFTVVSLTLDLMRWLEGPGAPIDPTDPANRSLIEERIQDSMEILEGG